MLCMIHDSTSTVHIDLSKSTKMPLLVCGVLLLFVYPSFFVFLGLINCVSICLFACLYCWFLKVQHFDVYTGDCSSDLHV